MWGVTNMVATNFGSGSISLCPEAVWASVCCFSMAVVSLGAWLPYGRDISLWHQPVTSACNLGHHPKICQLAKRHNMIDTRRMVVPWSVWKIWPLWTTTLNFCRHVSGCPSSVIIFLMASMVAPSSLEWSACGQSFLKGAPGEHSTRKWCVWLPRWFDTPTPPIRWNLLCYGKPLFCARNCYFHFQECPYFDTWRQKQESFSCPTMVNFQCLLGTSWQLFQAWSIFWHKTWKHLNFHGNDDGHDGHDSEFPWWIGQFFQLPVVNSPYFQAMFEASRASEPRAPATSARVAGEAVLGLRHLQTLWNFCWLNPPKYWGLTNLNHGKSLVEASWTGFFKVDSIMGNIRWILTE